MFHQDKKRTFVFLYSNYLFSQMSLFKLTEPYIYLQLLILMVFPTALSIASYFEGIFCLCLFTDLPQREKLRTVLIIVAKLILFLASLYFFICALGLLESAFQLLGGGCSNLTDLPIYCRVATQVLRL